MSELGVCITDDADKIQATGHWGPHVYSPDCWGWTSLYISDTVEAE